MIRYGDLGLNNKFILNFTPTGMIPTKALNPHVPITVEEIIKDVLEVASLGVSMVHLHARDPATGKRIKVARWRPGQPGGMGDRVMAQCLAQRPRIRKPTDSTLDAR